MSAENDIADVIQIYFDCMFESSQEKAHLAFHPDARITGYNRGELQEMSVTAFANFVGSQQPSAKAKGELPVLEIISTQVAGETAVATVRDVYLGRTFLDTLSFLKVDGRWVIYNKLFHVES
jgi:hypothetical protein